MGCCINPAGCVLSHSCFFYSCLNPPQSWETHDHKDQGFGAGTELEAQLDAGLEPEVGDRQPVQLPSNFNGYTIGSAGDNVLVISSEAVSEHHARIEEGHSHNHC